MRCAAVKSNPPRVSLAIGPSPRDLRWSDMADKIKILG